MEYLFGLFLVGLFLSAIWFFIPFAIFGIKPRLKKIIDFANEIAMDLKKIRILMEKNDSN